MPDLIGRSTATTLNEFAVSTVIGSSTLKESVNVGIHKADS